MSDEELEKEKNHLKVMIDKLALVLEGNATDAVKSYEITTEAGKRRIDKVPLTELFKLRESYIEKLKSLERGGKRKLKQIKVRF